MAKSVIFLDLQQNQAIFSKVCIKSPQLKTEPVMPITEILAENARRYGDDVALVEINPQELEKRHTTWKEYSLIEPSRSDSFRSEMTWGQFDRKANRLANFLLTRHLHKGAEHRVAFLCSKEGGHISFIAPLQRVQISHSSILMAWQRFSTSTTAALGAYSPSRDHGRISFVSR